MNDNGTALSRKESVGIWAGTGLWVAGLVTAIALALTGAGEWLAGGAAAAAVAGLLLVGWIVGRTVLRREGLERTAGIESSALAFWIVMAGALSYGIVDAFAGVPPVRPIYLVGFGMLAWAVAHSSRLRRYT